MSDSNLTRRMIDVADRDEIRRLCFVFKQAYESGAEPSIESILEEFGGSSAEALLLELIAIDLQHRETSGGDVNLETYCARFPDHVDAIKGRFVSGSKPADSETSHGADDSNQPNQSISDTKDFAFKTLGRYQLREFIGSGAFGDVWRAYDPQLRRDVALKTPRDDITHSSAIRRQFVAEGRKAARLKHPGIVTVYDAGEDQGRCYIVSEFISGGTLRQRLSAGPLDAEAAAKLIHDVACALGYAHQNGIVHRDIKPGNILLDEAGHPYISDFGLAKVESVEASMSEHGKIVGTPAYMSPEQASGLANLAGARTDIYALGVVMFEALTGRRPFVGKDAREVLARIRDGQSQAFEADGRDIPESMKAVCRQAMAQRPEDRYATATEFAAALRELIPDSAVEPAADSGKWSFGRVAGILLFFFGALFSGVFLAGSLLRPQTGIPVEISTNPPEAHITFIPLDATTGAPLPKQAVKAQHGEIARARLESGRYLVVAVLDDQRFHEVYRTVPAPDVSAADGPFWHLFWLRNEDGSVWLPKIRIPDSAPTDEMLRFEGSKNFGLGATSAQPTPSYWVDVPPFFADPRKVDREIFAERIGIEKLPGRFCMRPDEERKPFEEGQAPLTFVSWEEAMQFAELAGLRLLDEAEFEFAAKRSIGRESPAAPKQDWLKPPGEWTSSTAASYPLGSNQITLSGGGDNRVVRGAKAPPGPEFAQQDGAEIAAGRRSADRQTASADIGFRLGRSVKPRLQVDDFIVRSLPRP